MDSSEALSKRALDIAQWFREQSRSLSDRSDSEQEEAISADSVADGLHRGLLCDDQPVCERLEGDDLSDSETPAGDDRDSQFERVGPLDPADFMPNDLADVSESISATSKQGVADQTKTVPPQHLLIAEEADQEFMSESSLRIWEALGDIACGSDQADEASTYQEASGISEWFTISLRQDSEKPSEPEGSIDADTTDEESGEWEREASEVSQHRWGRTAVTTYQMWLRKVQQLQPPVYSQLGYHSWRFSAEEERALFQQLEALREDAQEILANLPEPVLTVLASLQTSAPECMFTSRKAYPRLCRAIKQYVLNSPDDTADQLERLREGLSETVLQYLRVRSQILKANVRLVLYVAERCPSERVDRMDLLQEGYIGLLKAIERFDWRLGNRFSTYAFWWIRQSILRAYSDAFRVVRLPAHMCEKRSKFFGAVVCLATRLGRQPTEVEIERKTGFSTEEIRDLLTQPVTNLRLDQHFTPRTTVERRLALDRVDPEEQEGPAGVELPAAYVCAYQRFMAEAEGFGSFRECRFRVKVFLPPTERQFVEARLGWSDGKPKPLLEQGILFSLVRERERQRDRLERVPKLGEIVDGLELPDALVDQMQALASIPLELDQPLKYESLVESVIRLTQLLTPAPSWDILYEHLAPSPEEGFDVQLKREALDVLLATLPYREAWVLRMRFGLEDGEAHTLAWIGQRLGVSRERVRQIEVQALDTLQRFHSTWYAEELGYDWIPSVDARRRGASESEPVIETGG